MTTMKIAISFLLCLAVLSNVSCLPTNTNHESKQKKVLLILIDGFRWDYLNQTGLIGFPRIAREGIQAEYMEALYPSESFPGYYSVATGLFAESHGMILNYMYDNEHKKFSQMSPNTIVKESFWWEDVEPIWITTTKQNISTAMLMWPGSSTTIRGRRAQIVEPYSEQNGVEHFRSNLNQVLDLFQNDHVRYAQVYCEHTDKIGHMYGPNSIDIVNAVRELDQVINQFLDNITMKGLEDSIHFVIVSDHGMTATDSKLVKRIVIDHILPSESVIRVLDRGSHMGIFPAEGVNVDEMITELKKVDGLDVYKREDIPEKYHFKNHRRVPPIYIVVHKGYFLQGLSNKEKQFPVESADRTWGGFHGYDPVEPDMRAIFLAWGKSLKRGYKSPPIHITDPYNLLAHFIGIEPLPNNGTWSKMQDLLTDTFNGSYELMASTLILILSSVVHVFF